MQVNFRLQVYTRWGEEVVLNMGGRSCVMQCSQAGVWETGLQAEAGPVTYHYSIYAEGRLLRSEHRHKRLVCLPSLHETVFLSDHWFSDSDEEDYLFKAAFRDVLLKRESEMSEVSNKLFIIRVFAPILPARQSLFIAGNHPDLGHWQPGAHLVLRAETDGYLAADLPAELAQQPFAYKFGLFDTHTHSVVQWEDGPDRIFLPLEAGLPVLHTDYPLRMSFPQWRGAGLAIPVFSLRTAQSCGIGEFYDLRLLADWAMETGLNLVQLLPVNDTSATFSRRDSYPYKAITAFALHPAYLNIEQTGFLTDKLLLKRYNEKRILLNRLPELDYDGVIQFKMSLLRSIFEENRERLALDPGLMAFCRTHREWLFPYVAFCVNRDQYGTTDFSQWGADAVFDDELWNNMQPENLSPAHLFYCFVQRLLFVQLYESIEYAHSRRVVIKGDIPIGVNPQGVETWAQPELFNLNAQAGAPPDDFSRTGQNWGFPTYRWDVMALDDFAWWQKRLRLMELFFDAYRIDHILGFFRIWEIPIHAVEGLTGCFRPALPLSPAEILAWGIPFDSKRFCEPYLTDQSIDNQFKGLTSEIVSLYLEPAEPGDIQYRFRPEFSSQKKLRAAVEGGYGSVAHLEGLYALMSDVLFLEDAQHSGLYHPRINLDECVGFQALEEPVREKLLLLHDDFFYRRHDEYWKKEALSKLPRLIEASQMLVCGEDLGMVPSTVPEVMKALRILSLEIQRMPKERGQHFSNPLKNNYMSVCSPGTHDMSVLRGWWEEDPKTTALFADEVLGMKDAPNHLSPQICEQIVDLHLNSPAMWAIFPLQDLLALDENLRRVDANAERINVPANPDNYWGYRMHLCMEDLLSASAFNMKINAMVKRSGRGKSI